MGSPTRSLGGFLSCLQGGSVSEKIASVLKGLPFRCVDEFRPTTFDTLRSTLKTYYSCWRKLLVCQKYALAYERERIFYHICGEVKYQFPSVYFVRSPFAVTVGFRGMLDLNVNLTITKFDVPLNPMCKDNVAMVITRVAGQELELGREAYCGWGFPKTLLLERHHLLKISLITRDYRSRSSYDIKMLYRPFLNNSFAVVQQHPYQSNVSMFRLTEIWQKALMSVSLRRVHLLIQIRADSYEQRLTLRIAGLENRKMDSLTDMMFSVHDGPDASMPYALYIPNSGEWTISGFVAVLEVHMAVGVEEAKYARVLFNTVIVMDEETTLRLHDTLDREIRVGGRRHYESTLVHVYANEGFVEVSVVDLDTTGFFWETCDYGGILLGESAEERRDEFPFDPYCDPSLEGATIWTSHGRFLRVFLFAYGADTRVKLKVRTTACQGYVACTENLTPLTNRKHYVLTSLEGDRSEQIVPKPDECVNIHFPSTPLDSKCTVTVAGDTDVEFYRVDLDLRLSPEQFELIVLRGSMWFNYQCTSVLFRGEAYVVDNKRPGNKFTVTDTDISIFTHYQRLSNHCPASYAFVSATARKEKCPSIIFHPMGYQSNTEIMTWQGQCATVLFTPRIGDSHRLLIQPRNPPRGTFLALTVSRHNFCNMCVRLGVYDEPFRFSVDLQTDYNLEWPMSGPQARIDLDTERCNMQSFCLTRLVIQVKYRLDRPTRRQASPASLDHERCAFNHTGQSRSSRDTVQTEYKVLSSIISSSRPLSWLEASSLCQDSGFYLWSPSTRSQLRDVLSAAYPYPGESPQARQDGCSSLRQLFNTTVAYIGLKHSRSSVSLLVCSV